MSRARSGWVLVLLVASLGGCSGAPSLPISVSVSPSSAQAIDQGLPISIKATVTNDVSSKGVAWSLRGVGSLSSSTGASVSYISPTAVLTSAQQVTVTAASVTDPTKSASVQITINPYPAMPYQALTGGTVGVPYSQPIALTGGTAPFQWSVYNGPIDTGWEVGGSVPDGLTLNASTGVISGTPTGAGTWYFELTATDADGAFVYQAVSIQINPAGPVTANAVPFLNQPLAPAAVAPGSGGLTLRVSGSGFVSGATVDFNGVPLTTTFVDSKHLSAVVPATDVATAKTASVTVVNPAPGGGSSNGVYFQVGAPEATVSFVNAANSPLQVPEAFQLTIADLNQDGKPDLAIAASVRLDVLLSNGDGTFAMASGSPVKVPSPPYDDFGSPYTGPMAVGDFNGSGHPGLAVSEADNSAAVILLGNGSGALVPSSAAFADSPDSSTFAIQAADFNGDGNLDLALVNQPFVFIDLGYGKGAFNTAWNLYNDTELFPSGVAVGDFNGDGKLDAAVASSGSTKYPDSGVTAWLGKGDGTFTQANGAPVSVGLALSAIVAGDFNGDGKLDLAVTDEGGSSVFVLLGRGDGSFQPAITIATGAQPQAIVVGDFNNDGKLDLATANYGDGTVTLLLGKGDGTFTQASGSPYAVGKGPTAIAAADFNGDGKLDLAVANSWDGTVSILLQQ